MWRKLGIEPGEGRIFAWSTAALLLVGWTDATVQNVADALFNKRIGVDYLPLAYLASSLLLIVTGLAFARLAARGDRLKLLPRTLFGLGVFLIPLWLLARAEVEAVFPVLVVASGQVTSLSLIAFFTAINDLLHTRQAKRLFGLMMTGVTVGTIVGNRGSGPLGAWLGIEALLLLAAGALMLCAVVAWPLRGLRPRFDRAHSSRALRASSDEPAATSDSFAALWRSSVFFRLLFVTVLCSGLLGPMLYFQFHYVATTHTAAGMEGAQELLDFYGRVKAWMYGGVLFVQIGFVRSIYRRIGLPLAAALSPVIYLLGFFGLSVRLSLPVGIGAMAGIKLQDKAVYDPAVRVLYNLFSDESRARASALLEGPTKRAGGALGNVVTLFANHLGSAAWVGYTAIPIAVAWLGTALVLWRRYPRLLLDASAERTRHTDVIEDRELLDRATVRALIPEICSDAAAARVAIELVAQAERKLAIDTLAEAAAQAPPETRHQVVVALDRLLESCVADPVESPGAARQLEKLLSDVGNLAPADRADLVQAYGRLLNGEEAVSPLEQAFADPEPAVRLVARAALVRRGVESAGSADELDAALAAALAGDDPAARRAAREELRSLLLLERGDPRWEKRMGVLAGAFASGDDAAEVVEAFAEVAARHGEAAAAVRDTLLARSEDPDPRIRSALLRFCGHAGLQERAAWLIEHLGSERAEWVLAAREGLLALGPASSNALLRELSYGRRRKREGILEVMRELDLHPEALRAFYEGELDAVERDLGRLVALDGRHAFELLRRRLSERVSEELHTALLFLSAIRGEDRIAELGGRLRAVAGRRRQHAVVLEALDAVLVGDDKRRLMGLLEDPDVQVTALTFTRRGTVPGVDEAVGELLEDPDPLTRQIAAGVAVAAGFEVDDHGSVDAVEKMKHLAALPMLAGLTARQLMDLAAVVKEHNFAADATVVTQGEADDCLYLVVDGVVHITRGDTLLAELGPGEFFGEIALFEGVARTANALTRTKARLLGLQRGDLIHLIEDFPGIAITLLETQSRRVRELTDRLMV